MLTVTSTGVKQEIGANFRCYVTIVNYFEHINRVPSCLAAVRSLWRRQPPALGWRILRPVRQCTTIPVRWKRAGGQAIGSRRQRLWRWLFPTMLSFQTTGETLLRGELSYRQGLENCFERKLGFLGIYKIPKKPQKNKFWIFWSFSFLE